MRGRARATTGRSGRDGWGGKGAKRERSKGDGGEEGGGGVDLRDLCFWGWLGLGNGNLGLGVVVWGARSEATSRRLLFIFGRLASTIISF